jgi:hypothetical protein
MAAPACTAANDDVANGSRATSALISTTFLQRCFEMPHKVRKHFTNTMWCFQKLNACDPHLLWK